MIEQRATQVAQARAKFSDATQTVAGIAARLNEATQRIAEAQSRMAAALAGLRSGEIPEDVGAARMAVAKADIADLEQLATEVRSEAANAEQVRNAAAEALRHAEEGLAHAEREAVIQGLDERIARLDSVLCQAIAERHRLGIEQAGGGHQQLNRSWKPSEALHRAVVFQVPPAS
ncbi:hypothetical protein ACU4HD_14145 [Cupriavidus basilensis]